MNLFENISNELSKYINANCKTINYLNLSDVDIIATDLLIKESFYEEIIKTQHLTNQLVINIELTDYITSILRSLIQDIEAHVKGLAFLYNFNVVTITDVSLPLTGTSSSIITEDVRKLPSKIDTNLPTIFIYLDQTHSLMPFQLQEKIKQCYKSSDFDNYTINIQLNKRNTLSMNYYLKESLVYILNLK